MATKSTVSKITAATIAAAALVAIPFIHDREGDKLESYADVGNVWTICGGVTAGIKPGMRMTQAQCDELTHSTIGQFMSQVAGKLTVEVPAKTLAAHTSFAYNVGLAGYAGSKALKLTNAGDLKGGCRAMANWYTAGGRDCRVRSNNCYGVVQRRAAEVKLCLEEL